MRNDRKVLTGPASSKNVLSRWLAGANRRLNPTVSIGTIAAQFFDASGNPLQLVGMNAQRLLDETVLTRPERRNRQVRVQIVTRGDEDRLRYPRRSSISSASVVAKPNPLR